MLSASSMRRWSSRVRVEGASIIAEMAISVLKIKKPGTLVPGFQSLFRFLVERMSSVEQQDRQRRDPRVRTTTTCAAAAAQGGHRNHHGTPGSGERSSA